MRHKGELRQHARTLRAGLATEFRHRASHAICERLIARQEFMRARTVDVFIPFGDEVDILPAIHKAFAAGKRIITQRVPAHGPHLEHYFIDDLDGLIPGPFGIPEPDPETCPPAAVSDADLIIVPGLLFDRHGNRLGYGKGFYDRFLAQTQALKIAVAFSVQLIDAVPVTAHDIPVDMIITEQGVLICRQKGPSQNV